MLIIQYDKVKHETQMTKRIHKRNTALERSVSKILEGFNMFYDTNLTLSSDVYQDTFMFDSLEKSLINRYII